LISPIDRNLKRAAIFELVIAGIFWGLSFPAAKISLKYFTPFGLGFFRPFFTFCLGEVIYFLFFKSKSQQRAPLKEAFIPGIILAGLIYSNNICLINSSSSMCAFLTCLYAVEVLAINKWYFKHDVGGVFYLCIFSALVGIALLTGIDTSESWIGILLGVLCSLVATIQILFINYKAPQITDVLRFNNYQQLWSSLILLPGGLIQGMRVPKASFTFEILVSFFFLCLLVGVFAFSLQVRAQKILSSHLASLLFLLESPFAVLFSYMMLGETLSIYQYWGGLFVFLACFFAVLSERTSN